MDFQGRRQNLKTEYFAIGNLSQEFNANLFYLTGITGAGILIRQDSRETLFLQKQTEKEILFDGININLESLVANSGLQDIRLVDLSSLEIKGLNSESILPEIAKLRMIKDEHEISLMRKASHISRRAHDSFKKLICEGAHEWDLKVEFERELFLNGCRETAYGTISAAGSNSTVLHARSYDRKIQKTDIFLLDGAGKFQNYASDITTTFSVGGSEEANAIMEIVKKAQAKVIRSIQPGKTLGELHKLAKDSLSEDLLRLGVIESKQEISDLFPHNTSHWIGLEVHDPKSTKNDSELELKSGMTFTVEPGIYFSSKLKKDYGTYQGIGVRFEEDLLVTENGCEILSRC